MSVTCFGWKTAEKQYNSYLSSLVFPPLFQFKGWSESPPFSSRGLAYFETWHSVNLDTHFIKLSLKHIITSWESVHFLLSHRKSDVLSTALGAENQKVSNKLGRGFKTLKNCGMPFCMQYSQQHINIYLVIKASTGTGLIIETKKVTSSEGKTDVGTWDPLATGTIWGIQVCSWVLFP